jgi:2-iminobutanoate/2-iminopropanoate deaminase
MPENKNFNTSKATRMSQVFPQAVIADKVIFLSGTPGLDVSSGQVVSNDFEQQTKRCFLNIKAPARSTSQVMPFQAGILISVECIALI